MVRFTFFVSVLFVVFSAGVIGQYNHCTGNLNTINDGQCDMDNNNEECGYDGGDCCECSCANDRLYPCGILGFNCYDPDVIDNTAECQNETAYVRNCASGNPVTWLVNNTASAIALADMVNCSGGVFNVTWLGNVSIDRTLYILDGTTLYVVGKGSGAEVNGGGKIRLFMAVGANLHIEGLILSNGNASYGGAIAATRSSLYLNQTLSIDNIASTYGGAIYAGMNSTVVWGGRSALNDNTAGKSGGAVSVSMGSTASWDGHTEFSSNTATGYESFGGALFVNDNSRIEGNGETFFANNSASNSGGALGVFCYSTLSLDGVTSFENNTAGNDGGALYAYFYSTVSSDGDTLFVNNMARNSGGALSVLQYSNVSWNGVTSFENNTASNNGGALYLHSYSDASWGGETSFINNAASQSYGGALYAHTYCTISWDGRTSFVNSTAYYAGALSAIDVCTVSWNGQTFFVNNKARGGGGAVVAGSRGNITWDGETSFLNNTAGGTGGALRVEFDSIVSWKGDTSFAGNNASSGGGALFVFLGSTVMWDGDTSFVHNIASDGGGALYVWSDSSVTWTGNTSFLTNTALSSGGAIYVFSDSNITMEGDSYFIDNEATTDGGAVFVYVGYADKIPSYFRVDNNSVVFFQGNTCGGNGGAIAFIGGVVTRFSSNVIFRGNTAEIGGGAIYMSGVNSGMHFEGTRFLSNSAVIGGGLYSTGSGTAVTGNFNRNPEYHPTTLIECEFIGNKATKTGGAMDSGAGRDLIVNSSFVGNTASLGGALRLVGTTSLTGCDFVNNLSGEDEGPGVSNDGVIEPVKHCTFANNSFNCQTGFFLAQNETGALFDTVCKGCDTQCTKCEFEGKEPICLEELEHSMSTGGTTSLESLLIDRGYWRATNTSTDILACYNTDACLGGLTREQGYCRKGYEGPYCSVCSKGYTASLGFTCNKCSGNAARGIAFAVVMAVVLLFAFLAFLSYMLSGEIMGTNQGFVARLTRFIPLQSVKIVIVVWQILTQFSTVANVVFPSAYQSFLDGVDVLNFNLSWLLSVECIIDTDFHDQLLLATLGPLVCMAILGGTYVTAMRQSHNSEEARKITRRKHVSMVLLLTFLVYSSVSSTLFKTFACDKLDDGKNYLRADYRIDCDSSKHDALEIYAGFMVVLYVVGIPAFYGILLYNNREALMKNPGREEDDSVRYITDLWKSYRPNRFYYEVIECVRRVLLTGALVFIYPNTAAQIAVALMMATLFIFVSEALAPYASACDTWCSRTGHAIVYTSMFLALLLKVDVSGERPRSQRVFESVLITAHACLVLFVVAEAFAAVVVWRREEVKEDTEPRIRLCLSASSSGVVRGGTILGHDDPPSYENVVRNM